MGKINTYRYKIYVVEQILKKNTFKNEIYVSTKTEPK